MIEFFDPLCIGSDYVSKGRLRPVMDRSPLLIQRSCQQGNGGLVIFGVIDGYGVVGHGQLAMQR